jgi:ABC-type uncharacterized transport system auxiliary subunit
MNMRRGTPLIVLLLLFTVSGCGGILTSDQPARQYYALMPLGSAAGGDGATAGPALVVGVRAVPGLDTDRILALGPDARLNRYANARWPDHLPEVLASVLQRSLTFSGEFGRVGQGERAMGDEWLLQLEVQEFYGIYNADGSTTSVTIAMMAALSCNGRETVLHLSAARPVREERLETIVAAHQAGLDDVTRQVLARIGEFCAEA